jgi:hypothetical protein
MEICMVHLADSAGEARTIEVCHEIDVMTSQMGVVSEVALVEGELEGAVMRVA